MNTERQSNKIPKLVCMVPNNTATFNGSYLERCQIRMQEGEKFFSSHDMCPSLESATKGGNGRSLFDPPSEIATRHRPVKSLPTKASYQVLKNQDDHGSSLER